MSNVVKLYYTTRSNLAKEWELIPSKLLIVDNIGDYLATKSSQCTTINNFQYVKNKLEIAINVDLAQSYSQPKATTSYKYVSIQNDGELIHYYFVKSCEWRSKTCVRLELVMDVLNTFQEGYDYTFKANTKINREHKDRFEKRVQNRYLTFLFFTYMTTGTVAVDDEVKVYDENTGEMLKGKIITIDYPETFFIRFKIQVDSADTRTDLQILAVFSAQAGHSVVVKKNNFNYITGTLSGGRTFTHDYALYRKIDPVEENINPILQCGVESENLIENPITTLKQDWYLLYRNQNTPDPDSLVNPVDCFLIPQKETKVDSAYIEEGRLIPSFLEEGKYYFFLVASGKTFTLSNGVSATYFDAYHKRILLITKAGGKIFVQNFLADNYSSYDVVWYYDDIDFITITGLPANYKVFSSPQQITWNFLYNTLNFPETFNNSGTYNTIDPITLLDRVDSKNIKLIKLPYCPYDFEVVEGVLQIEDDTQWEYASITQSGGGVIHCLRLIDLHSALSSNLSEGTYQPLKNMYFGLTTDIEPSSDDLKKDDSYESKLFHSSFYQPTYCYDSFAFKLQLEKIYLDGYNYTTLQTIKIKFDVTKTINSRFLFTFANYYCKDIEQNYEKYLPIARNNEEVLYNVPYVNYIRNGFNYDVKAKNIANVSNYAGLTLSAVGTAASLVLPGPLKIAGLIGGAVSMAMSIKNTITSTIQNEDSIKRKLTEAQNQAASVAGSDDVDLMSIYAKNRLKYLVYQPRDVMKELIFNLFFYAGYNSGRMGLPSHNTRVNFDYLECDASIECLASMPEDCVEELVNAFKSGVTYLHKTNRTTDKWDFAQKYENWEVSLLEE